jgi:tetratricopeptide (TPR) repeat protein
MRHVFWLTVTFAFAPLTGAFAAPIAPPVVEDAAESPEKERPAEIRSAIEKFEEGDAAGAYEQLKTAAAAHDHLPPPQVMLANLYFSSGNNAAGRLALEQAAVEAPDDPETYLILGDLLLRERRWTEAETLFARAEPLWEKYSANDDRKRALEARLCSGQAAVAEARGSWDDAVKLLARWQELAPKNSQAVQRLGRAYFMLKREKDAFAAFEAAGKLAENAPPAPISMAMLFQQQGNTAKGEEWIKYALEKAPNDFATQLGAAQWNWEAGRLPIADKHAEAALKIQPDSLDAQLLAAQTDYYQHDFALAEPRLEKLREQAPGNFVAANLLAWTLADSDDAAKRKRAVELAGLNAERFPGNAEAVATLGWSLYRAGHAKEAVAQLARIKGNASLSRDAAYRVARVMYEANERDKALELLEGTLKSTGLFAAEKEARDWQTSLTRGGRSGP